MIVTLTGYMGSGKSTVGGRLASLLGCDFVDLDCYIADKAGRSIPEIFEEDGEKAFRAIEAEALRDVVVMHELSCRDAVIALGGGTVMTAALQKLIFSQTFCIWLKPDVGTLLRRVGDGSGRPLADGHFAQRLKEREPIYARARMTVETEGLSADQVAMLIASELNKNDVQ